MGSTLGSPYLGKPIYGFPRPKTLHPLAVVWEWVGTPTNMTILTGTTGLRGWDHASTTKVTWTRRGIRFPTVPQVSVTIFQNPPSIPSRKLTWKPKKGPIKTTVPLKGSYMGFHVSLGEYTGSWGRAFACLGKSFCKRKNYLVPFAFDPLHPRQLSFHITAVAEIVSISPSHCNVALAGIKNDSKLFRSVLRI